LQRWPYRPGDHGTRSHHGFAADDDAGQDDRARPDGRAVVDGGNEKFFWFLLAAWKSVVGERGIGSDEDIVTHPQAVPQLHAALDGDAVAHHHVVFDQAVRADVAILPDLGTGQDDDKLPDARACTNGGRLNI